MTIFWPIPFFQLLTIKKLARQQLASFFLLCVNDCEHTEVLQFCKPSISEWKQPLVYN